MTIQGNNAYIVVNNSGKIEVVSRNDLKSVAIINGLVSPRYISFVNEKKAYVTSLYSDSWQSSTCHPIPFQVISI